jgi:hypothetical protein
MALSCEVCRRPSIGAAAFWHPKAPKSTGALAYCNKDCLDVIKHHYDKAIELNKFTEFMKYYGRHTERFVNIENDTENK